MAENEQKKLNYLYVRVGLMDRGARFCALSKYGWSNRLPWAADMCVYLPDNARRL